MKKTIRILVPIILVLTILGSCFWYLFIYDQTFTRDALLSVARFCQNNGYHGASTWFYDLAYKQIGDNDSVAIELAQQYKDIGNYTKAEYTLRNAIQDGASAELYIALCKTFVEQDKLLDAVNMLNNITDPAIKEILDRSRPEAPTSSHESGQYNQYISVSVTAPEGTLYVTADGEYPSLKTDLYDAPISLKEGENNIYAISVAENGLVSPLATFGYTIGGIIKPVTFADPAVESTVREQLLLDAETVVYTNDLWKIKELTVPGDAKDYSDIALMTYLETLTAEDAVSSQLYHITGLSELTELHITGSNVSPEDLEAISKLPKLTKLTLSDCDLSTVTALRNAATLAYLDLSNNAVRNLDFLSGLSNLTEIHLSHNAVEDLRPISNLPGLIVIDISYNAITNLDAISSMYTLHHINADHNAITQINGVNALTALTYLSVNANQITDISAVSGCSELTELYIAENGLTDITVLNKLNNLMHLDFSNNSVTTVPTWSKNCALVSINGSYNKIKSLAPLSGLKSLNTINMEYNKDISSVKELADCPLLVQINVYGTKVKEVSALTEQSIIVNYNPV